jgi:hypothetical protein
LTIHHLFAVCQAIVDILIIPDKFAGVKGFWREYRAILFFAQSFVSHSWFYAYEASSWVKERVSEEEGPVFDFIKYRPLLL